ncbi:MAG: terminase family protein [Pseudomonadota bacterium]|nr:terminase family protein [Pseudomonadota bacterium]
MADPGALITRVTGNPPDPWQEDFFAADDEFLLLLASRGVGKSTSVGVMAYEQAELRQRQTILVLAPALRQAGETYNRVLDVRRAFGAVHVALRETMLLIELSNGSRVIVAPATEKTIRGYRADLIVLDEAARIGDEEFGAIVPMLKDGGRIIACTTPAGRRGWFYDACREGRGRLIRARSTDLPRMSRIVERDRRIQNPAQFRTEHLLEFQGSGDAFFDIDAVDRMFAPHIQPLRLVA